MTPRLAPWLAALGMVLVIVTSTPAADPDPLKADEKLLQQARVGTDGVSLLDFFRKRTLEDAARDRILGLIAKLGDDDFRVREQAQADLIAFGQGAAALLRQAIATTDDIEVIRRCERSLELIDKESRAGLAAAVARVTAARKPESAAAVLLDYLPFSDDESTADEVRAALARLAVKDGKPDPALVDALDDKEAHRRAAAAQALVRASKGDQRDKFTKFLQDEDPSVRLHTAQAFFDVHDKRAVPVLISLLTDLPMDRAYGIEDTLYQLAGDDAPLVSISKAEGAVKKAQTEWKAWWAKNGDKIDLSKFDPNGRLLGHTLVVEWGQVLTQGKVKEIDRDGNVRWSIENLSRPVDALVLANDRVAIFEYNAKKLSVRDFKGNEIWQKVMTGYPSGLQKLSNGNLLAITRSQVIELDRDGKEVSSYTRNVADIYSAHKGRDGKLTVVMRTGLCVRVDADGKEEKSYQIVGPGTTLGVTVYGGTDMLPNGHLLVPLGQLNKVAEVDETGKIVWEAAFTQPNSVVRLPNGRTLATNYLGNKAIEFDRDGKETWSYTGEGRYLLRVRKR